MRQAGILAAAGIIALEKMTARLLEDHGRATILAQGLSQVPGLMLDLGMPSTNMVFISLTEDLKCTTEAVIERLKERGILIGATGKLSYRLVTHYWIDDEGVEKTVEAFRAVLKNK